MKLRRGNGSTLWGWLFLLMAISSGCSTERADTPGLGAWEVESEAIVIIGLRSDQAESLLHIVADAVELPDGGIAVANGGFESRLSVFAADGNYIRSIGGPGDGPGEFHWITDLATGPADSLYVFDASAQRLTGFSPAGGVRTTSFRLAGGKTGADGLRTISRLTDDVWVGKGMESPIAGNVGEIIRDTIAIGLLDGSLTRFTPFLHLPGRMSTTFLVRGQRAFGSPPFSPAVIQTTWGQCVFVGTGEDPTISVFSSMGELVGVVEGPGQPRQTTESDVAGWIDWRLRDVGENEVEALRRAYDEIAIPRQLPYYNQMVADHWGRLWLEEYTPPQGTGRRWHLLSQAGDQLGIVIVPKPMRVFEITERGMLGSTLGDLGEEYVELIPLDGLPFESSHPLQECVSDA